MYDDGDGQKGCVNGLGGTVTVDRCLSAINKHTHTHVASRLKFNILMTDTIIYCHASAG